MDRIDQPGDGSAEHHCDDSKSREREPVRGVSWAVNGTHLAPVFFSWWVPLEAGSEVRTAWMTWFSVWTRRNYPSDTIRVPDDETRAAVTSHRVIWVEYTLAPAPKEGAGASSTNQGRNEDAEE